MRPLYTTLLMALGLVSCHHAAPQEPALLLVDGPGGTAPRPPAPRPLSCGVKQCALETQVCCETDDNSHCGKRVFTNAEDVPDAVDDPRRRAQVNACEEGHGGTVNVVMCNDSSQCGAGRACCNGSPHNPSFSQCVQLPPDGSNPCAFQEACRFSSSPPQRATCRTKGTNCHNTLCATRGSCRTPRDCAKGMFCMLGATDQGLCVGHGWKNMMPPTAAALGCETVRDCPADYCAKMGNPAATLQCLPQKPGRVCTCQAAH